MTRLLWLGCMILALVSPAAAQTPAGTPAEAPAVAAPAEAPNPATTPYLLDQPSGLPPILYAVPAGLLLVAAALGLVTLRAARRIREQGR